MQKNVGTWDAIMRITMGAAGLAWSTSCMTRKPGRTLPVIVAMMSGMKVAEGVTRFCPLLHAMGVTSTETEVKKSGSPNMPRQRGWSE
ncbi:YgaP family membrane protein [Paludifilum halophilum]|uniref:Inner membrane protein YgaP-like transmembrane domain-containing protein n=1 Tax=Paludifilum halophilum TaxID=1642702 RepID=A0A235B6L5_9BACL|nr:DUF2892 domain-containing protein [Paludifilum halophilum]OYD07527.1 hypothetical protein CHM34_11575 [Paludifilum halophilum]